MAGFDPSQPRDEQGKWTAAVSAARKAAGFREISTTELQEIADVSLPPDDEKYEYFYHATKWMEQIDSILEQGLQSQSNKIYLSKDEIRDRGAGFVIVRVPTGLAIEGKDVVAEGLFYREWTVPSVPPKDIVRAVRFIPYIGGGGHGIYEHELAAWAIKNPIDDTSDLPKKYKKWFNK